MSEMQINASGQMALEDGGRANSFRPVFANPRSPNRPNKPGPLRAKGTFSEVQTWNADRMVAIAPRRSPNETRSRMSPRLWRSRKCGWEIKTVSRFKIERDGDFLSFFTQIIPSVQK